ncbi:MAG: uroporphyrinogen-III C-methyltransferase, partial [Ruminococcus sp.]
MNTGKVYLIGAGCGEYDLITLRGMEILKKCDTIVYDSLIDERILSYAHKDAEKICVGKRAGMHSETQEKINGILVDKALAGRTVARLKGGDPFVFGRGGEEAAALSSSNIPFELIPGITSAVAVPEMAGIPVTHRSVSRSFHVITGHTMEDRLPKEMSEYAKLSGTLVFLMGLRHLKNIADSLIENGKAPDTPAAVVSNGGRKNQKTIRSTLKNIACESEKNGMESPAVIIVGETAAYDFCGEGKKDLEGITVTVTGTKRFSDRLAAKLERNGAKAARESILKIVSYFESDAFTDAVLNISDYTMAVLTSPNGAEIFIRKLRKMKTDFRKLSGIRFAV